MLKKTQVPIMLIGLCLIMPLLNLAQTRAAD